MELGKATSADDMQTVINVFMHDHRTGLPRGTPGPMICLAEQIADQTETEQRPETKQPVPEEPPSIQNTEIINAAIKGSKQGGKGQNKGYGQCWECGEYGHPRRGCKVFLERMCKGQHNTKQDLAALKGAGKFGKGGEWGKGKGRGTKGHGYYGAKGSKGYGCPGKAIGKRFKPLG